VEQPESTLFAVGTWDLTVNGVEHVVELALDPTTDRVLVRVDGRMAARPIAPEESSRQFMVAGERWSAVRRVNDEFDLEFVPPVIPSTPKAATPTPKKTKGIGGIIFKVVAAVVVLALIGLVKNSLRDLTSDWYEFSSPDGAFKFAMPRSRSRSAAPPPFQARTCSFTIWGRKMRSSSSS